MDFFAFIFVIAEMRRAVVREKTKKPNELDSHEKKEWITVKRSCRALPGETRESG